MSRCRPLVALALVALTVGACGVRGESSATKLDDIALPPEPVPEEASGTQEGPTTIVYFVQSEHLAPVERATQATLSNAVRGVLEGPRETESESGFRSAVPAGTSLLGVDLAEGVATIDLSDDFQSVVGPEQVLALAQLVYAATEIPGVTAVRFSIGGDPIDAARGDGSLSTSPVGRDDYPGALEG